MDFEANRCGVIFKLNRGIRPEGLREITKDLSQDSRFPGRDLNPEPSECEEKVLTTRPQRSVTCF
jgi:hypothetical protein